MPKATLHALHADIASIKYRIDSSLLCALMQKNAQINAQVVVRVTLLHTTRSTQRLRASHSPIAHMGAKNGENRTLQILDSKGVKSAAIFLNCRHPGGEF